MFTPGPWDISKHGDTIFGRRREDGGLDPIGFVYCPAFAERSEVGRTALETAKAITAFPDFYEAAMTMAHAEDSGGDAWWRGFAMLKAALRKAGGQFPSMDQP